MQHEKRRIEQKYCLIEKSSKHLFYGEKISLLFVFMNFLKAGQNLQQFVILYYKPRAQQSKFRNHCRVKRSSCLLLQEYCGWWWWGGVMVEIYHLFFLNLSPFISYFSLHSVSLYAGEHKFLQMGSNLGKICHIQRGTQRHGFICI